MKNKYLTVYDYGSGAVWRYIRADSADDIQSKYRELEVLFEEPDWFSSEYRASIKICEIDDTEDPFLQIMRKNN